MKIGIITMHKVLNFGSALQAYALQKVLSNHGYDCEIIDYSFPPKNSLFKRIDISIRYLIYKIRTGTYFEKSKAKFFKEFYNKFFCLSDSQYNKNNISLSNNVYDVFLTGSDQVWNPNWIKDDFSFLLSFTNMEKYRLSYASSFAINKLPFSSRIDFAKYLNRYNSITVRENSGVEIIRDLIGKEAELVLDPTLLLEASEYNILSKYSTYNIEGQYILVYMLTYMYNPFPEVNYIVEQVHKKIGGKVVYLGSGKYSMYNEQCISIENIGPCEFISLFEHASFVITSSFHGTAFASIFNKPLISTVKSLNDTDGRMPSLLKLIGGDNSIVEYNSKNIELDNIESYKCSPLKLAQERIKSTNILLNNIEKIK